MKSNKKRNRVISPRVISIGMAMMLLLIAGSFVRTWLGVQCTRTGYDIARAISEQQRLTNIQENLKVELARLQSPKTLGKAAREQFGLDIPKPEQIVIVP
jgi:cell division protein FtsL